MIPANWTEVRTYEIHDSLFGTYTVNRPRWRAWLHNAMLTAFCGAVFAGGGWVAFMMATGR